MGSYYQKQILQASEDWHEPLIGKFGTFAKVVFTPSPLSPDYLVPNILEHRRVSDSLEASYGAFYFPISSFVSRVNKKTRVDIKHSYSQLRNAQSNFKIAVIDLRYEAVDESQACWNIINTFASKKYSDLTGVVIMKLDWSSGRTRLVPVSNPYSTSRLDLGFLRGHNRSLGNYVEHSLFILSTKIRVEAHKWQDLIQMEPGHRIVRKGESTMVLYEKDSRVIC